jgi:hypothetical protein
MRRLSTARSIILAINTSLARERDRWYGRLHHAAQEDGDTRRLR